MIYNFIENYQRLPVSIQELRESSRFSTKCGSLNDFEDFLHYFHLSFCFYTSLLIYIVFSNSISLKELIITSIILIAIIFLLSMLSDWLNLFLQLFTTASHVTDDSLYLAYFVAREWMLHVYPEYTSEEWMQKSEFLDDISIT